MLAACGRSPRLAWRRVYLAHSEFADFAAMQADLHAIGNSVVLPFDATDPITLTDLQIQNLHAQNFHFF